MTATTFTNLQNALRGLLDALASAWMRRAAAGRAPVAPSMNNPVAMPPTCMNSSQPSAPKNATMPFQPLDPSVLNASIPAFFIGRDKDGFWLARDVKGRVGGIFLLESSALAFARRHSWPSGCATIYPSEKFELDVENQGNPLIIYLRPTMRFAMGGLHRVAGLTGAILSNAVSRIFTRCESKGPPENRPRGPFNRP
jgi:hypothetical protein